MKRKLAALLVTMVILTGLTACSPAATTATVEETTVSTQTTSTEAEASTNSTQVATAESFKSIKKEDIKIGEIQSYYINDGGWCQAVHTSIVNSMEAAGISSDKLVTLECIDEDQSSVESAFSSLIDEGCNVIIGCSTGYGSYLSDLADKYPDVVILQSGDDEDNMVGFQIKNQEGWFLAGYACALLSDQDQLGFAASMNEVSVRTAINAYALGAKYANENATVQVVWANSWYDVDVETQDALTLINAGIKYMGMDASSPAIPQTCQDKGAFVVGSNVDMHDSAPDAVLFSYMWNFSPMFNDMFDKITSGTLEKGTYYYQGGECSALSEFNDDLVSKDVQDKVTDLRSKLNSGEVDIYSGALNDVDGKELVKAGETMDEQTARDQNFFVSNVKGAQ